MLTEEQRDYLFPKAYNAAIRAGEAILELYKKGLEDYEIGVKDDMSPIILADYQAHNIIKEYLGQTRIPLLSEEGREMLYEERIGWDLFWMVDPLDGTKEFIKGNGEFTVNIALLADNKPVLSVLYVPYLGKIYLADRSKGAFVKESVQPDRNAEYTMEEIYGDASRLPIAGKANNPLRVAISRSHNTVETFRHIDRLKKKFPDAQVVEQGSSYKFCLIAEGTIDYYARTSPTYEWDTAAGELILELAGGSTAAIPDGKPINYNKESLMNPDFVCKSKYMPLL